MLQSAAHFQHDAGGIDETGVQAGSVANGYQDLSWLIVGAGQYFSLASDHTSGNGLPRQITFFGLD